MQTINVLFVSPSFYPATYYGGPTFVNRALCDALAANERIELQVLTTDANGPSSRIDKGKQTAHATYPIIYCRRMIQPDIAPGLGVRLFGMIRQADVVHLNAVYSFTTIPTLLLCKLLRKPVVWSLHGALQRWPGTRKGRSKHIWEKVCNLLCDRGRVFIHAVSTREGSESSVAISRAASAVIAYGIEVPPLNAGQSRRSDELRLLYLGRLHPIKGIENLLRALALTQQQATLEICGEGKERYERQLRSLTTELGLSQRVRFYGSVAGEAKEKHFRKVDICVIPSFTEGFATVVAEALARGVPVIAARGTPWQRIEEIGCGLYVSNEPQELAAAIDRAAGMPLNEMGRRGRAWMEREFAWVNVAGQMIDQYHSLVRREPTKETEVATCPKVA